MTYTNIPRTLRNGLIAWGIVASLAGCAQTETEPLSEKASQEWAQTFSEDLAMDEISVRQGVEELDKHLTLTKEEDFSEALEMMLYTLEVQAERYNNILANMTPEIDAVLEAHPELKFEEEEGWKKVENGLVKGLWKEINDLPFEWVEDKEGTYVQVSYDKFVDEFEQGMTDSLKQKIELSQHRLEKPDYNTEEYRLAFENIWERIEMLEDYRENGVWDDAMEDQYYFYVLSMYGFGEGTMNYDGGTLNVDAVAKMKEIADANPDHEVAKNMQTVIALMEKEEAYTDNVLEKTNDIVNKQFADYLLKLEERTAEMEAEMGMDTEDETDEGEEVLEEVTEEEGADDE